MATYAALTVTGGTTGTSTWANNIRDHVNVVCTAATRPGSPHEGMRIYETDNDRELTWNGSAWVYMGWTSPTGRIGCRLTSPAPITGPGATVANNTLDILMWGVEDYDPAGMHSSLGQIYAPISGAYMISTSFAWTTAWTNAGDFIRIQRNGGFLIVDLPVETSSSFWGGCYGPFDLDAGEYATIGVVQKSGSTRTINGGTVNMRYLSA